MEQLFGDLGIPIASEDDLRTAGTDPERREVIGHRFIVLGYDNDPLDDMRRLIDAPAKHSSRFKRISIKRKGRELSPLQVLSCNRLQP